MQRSAVNRISDLIAMVVYSVFLLYNLRWTVTYIHEVFWLHQTEHLFDLVLFIGLTILFGFIWGVIIWNVFHYRTFPWFFRNLGVYVPLLFQRFGEFLSRIFWLSLANVALWLMRHVLVLASWAVSKSYPGRGMVFSLDFEDERDFKSMVRTAREDGLPITASRDGRPVYDADLLESSLTYPPLATLHVVDADPTDL